MSAPHYQIYIDGRFEDTGRNQEIRSPATEELVATVAQGSVEHVDRAVAAAKAAHRSGVWSGTPAENRADLILRAAARLGERSEELAALQTRENGATIRITGALHVGLSLATLQNVAEQAKKYEWEKPGPPIGPVPAEGILRREPIGVVAAIVPWNIPFLVIAWKIGPALAAGNTVVLKPDEHAPLIALEIAKAFHEEGLPPGVLNVVTGDGEPVGSHLAGHPDVGKVAFTGSTSVGKSILARSAETVRPVTLELGGKGPNIILDDADLDIAVDGALFAAYANNGQACEAGTRLLVPRSRKAEILRRLRERSETLVLGDPSDPATHVGPIIDRVQQERVLGYLNDAKASGATVVTGGGEPTGERYQRGYWIEPTVLADVTNDQPIARDEVFGPVLVVIDYDTDEEAVEIANDTSYGLSAGVWSTDEARAVNIARKLQAGMVYVNDWHVISPEYPFGGYKESGLGREGGPDALDAYTEQKYISVDRAGSFENRAFAVVLDPPV